MTGGPTLTTTGISGAEAIAGVTTINGTGAWATTSTINFSGILSGATKTELNNAADATGRAAGDLRYASALNTLGWLPAGTENYFLRVSSGLPAWEAVSFDNYGSWSFRANAGATDAITSGDTLTFSDGAGINVTQSANEIIITNTETNTWRDIDNSPVDGENAISISSNWAYDHAIGQTVNLHTKVGTITNGTWTGTAIGNSYVAGLDQNCLTSSTVLHSVLLLSGAPSASGTDGRVTIGEYSDGIRIYEPAAGTKSGAFFGIFTLASPSGWILDPDGEDTYHKGDFLPYTGTTAYDLGNSSYKWKDIYGVNVYSGDIHLENEMVITEVMHPTEMQDDGRPQPLIEPLDGLLPGIEFKNRHGKTIMRLTEDGDLLLRGNIIPHGL